jgi:hypothetical protein
MQTERTRSICNITQQILPKKPKPPNKKSRAGDETARLKNLMRWMMTTMTTLRKESPNHVRSPHAQQRH